MNWTLLLEVFVVWLLGMCFVSLIVFGLPHRKPDKKHYATTPHRPPTSFHPRNWTDRQLPRGWVSIRGVWPVPYLSAGSRARSYAEYTQRSDEAALCCQQGRRRKRWV